jgi:hypothetical protein
MSELGKVVLAEFDRLSADEQRLVAAEILRRVTHRSEPIADEGFVLLAEQTLLALDAEEAGATENGPMG